MTKKPTTPDTSIGADLRAELEAAAARDRAPDVDADRPVNDGFDASAVSRERPSDQNRNSGALSREADESARFEHPEMDHWAPPSQLSLPPNDEKFVYRWVSEYVNGQYMSNRLSAARREGYMFVRMDELPEGFIVDEDTKSDGLARVGGLLMAKMPRRFAEQRKAFYAKRSAESLAGADQLQGVAGANAVRENRGTRSLDGRAAGDALRSMARSSV